MTFTTFTVNPFSENSYLLTRDGRAILFDPGFYSNQELENLTNTLQEQGATLDAIVLTHAHVDHVMGIPALREKHPELPVYLNHEDLYHWENYPDHAAMFGLQVPSFDFTPEPIELGSGKEVGGFQFDAYFTPGHAPEHLVFHFPDEKVLIAGDTLFKGSIGRTDLYKGSFEQLEESIRTQIYTLPDDTRILPGHGPETTVGEEKRSNPFVKG